MLNFIAINLATYLALNTLSDDGLVPGTDTIDPAARISPLSGLGLGTGRVMDSWWHLRRLSSFTCSCGAPVSGFRIRAVGLSPGRGELRRHEASG